MKKVSLYIIVTFAAILAANAYDAKINGIYYNFSGGEAEVTYDNYLSPSYSGVVVVPNTVTYNNTTYHVTNIGDYAFYGCSNLTSAIILFGDTLVYNKELIVNGDFSSGNAGFTSDYIYVSTTGSNALLDEGKYAVGVSPSNYHYNFVQHGDHTTGKGYMLIANGSPRNTDYVWKQHVVVERGKTYEFSAWFMAAVSYSTFKDDIEYSVNGIAIPGAYDKTENGWERYYGRYNATTTGEIEIKIRTKSVVANGNDFAIDDISFSTLSQAAAPDGSAPARIGQLAFYGCSSLTSVTIGSCVIAIGDNAFAGCEQLSYITSYVTSPFSIKQSVFTNYDKARLYVPQNTKNLYRNTACWNLFKRIYTIDSDEERQDLMNMLTSIDNQLYYLGNNLSILTEYSGLVKEFLSSAGQSAPFDDADLNKMNSELAVLKVTSEQLWIDVPQAGIADMDVLWDATYSLQSDVTLLLSVMSDLMERTKAQVVKCLQNELTSISNKLQNIQMTIATIGGQRQFIYGKIGTDYFLLKVTDKFEGMLGELNYAIESDWVKCSSLLDEFKHISGLGSISTLEEAMTLYQNYMKLKGSTMELESLVNEHRGFISNVLYTMESLEVNFPDEELAYTIRPTGLDGNLQLGYKSDIGFVLTSAGMMWFEQKEGADFYLRDADGNYIVATPGNTTLRTGTKDEATVWTGESIGGDNYTFYSKDINRYLGTGGTEMNNAIIVSTKEYNWTITESELDELQAFLNLLAEEEEAVGIEMKSGKSSDSDCYDLLGRKVTKAQMRRGIYIINNTKYMKK